MFPLNWEKLTVVASTTVTLSQFSVQQVSQKRVRSVNVQRTKSMCMLKCSYLANVKSKLPDNGSPSTVWCKPRKFKTSKLSGFGIPLSWMTYICQSVVLNKMLRCILKNRGVPEECCFWDTFKNGIAFEYVYPKFHFVTLLMWWSEYLQKVMLCSIRCTDVSRWYHLVWFRTPPPHHVSWCVISPANT